MTQIFPLFLGLAALASDCVVYTAWLLSVQVFLYQYFVYGMQGALDGGLDIPHGEKRFVGYSTEDKKLDPEQLKKYILGGHVSPVPHLLVTTDKHLHLALALHVDAFSW